jgi:hypothetical protein
VSWCRRDAVIGDRFNDTGKPTGERRWKLTTFRRSSNPDSERSLHTFFAPQTPHTLPQPWCGAANVRSSDR